MIGFVHIAAMLRNPAYTGRWSFGKKQWRKDPTTRKRRYLKRPAHDVRESDRPHLRIVPDDLWEAVREHRHEVRANYAGTGDGAPGLRQVLLNGKITLTPGTDGSCQATSMLVVGCLT